MAIIEYLYNNQKSIILYQFQTMKMTDRKRNELRVVDKKLEGDKVYYLVVKNRSKKWIDFEHMDDHLEQVMQYEKAQEESKRPQQESKQPQPSSSPSSTPSKPLNTPEKLAQLRKSVNPKCSAVANILFMNKVQNELFFKVYYEGGYTEVVSGKVLRVRHPQEMISFYERHVKIQDGL